MNGFLGFVITDQASFPGFEYCNIIEGLEAGTDMWLNTSTYLWKLDIVALYYCSVRLFK